MEEGTSSNTVQRWVVLSRENAKAQLGNAVLPDIHLAPGSILCRRTGSQINNFRLCNRNTRQVRAFNLVPRRWSFPNNRWTPLS